MTFFALPIILKAKKKLKNTFDFWLVKKLAKKTASKN